MESSGPSQSEQNFKAPKTAAESATDATMGQMQQESFNDQKRGNSGSENLKNDVNKAKKLLKAARNFFGGKSKTETQFDNHGTSGASEVTVGSTAQAEEQAQFRETHQEIQVAPVDLNTQIQQAGEAQRRNFAETQAAAEAQRAANQANRPDTPEPTPPLEGASRGRDDVVGDGGQMLDDIAAAGVELPGGRRVDASPSAGDTPAITAENTDQQNQEGIGYSPNGFSSLNEGPLPSPGERPQDTDTVGLTSSEDRARGQVEGGFASLNEGPMYQGGAETVTSTSTEDASPATNEDRARGTSPEGFSPVNEASPIVNQPESPEDRFSAARAAAEQAINPTGPDEGARGVAEGGFSPLNEESKSTADQEPEDRWAAIKREADGIPNPTRPDDQARGVVEGGFSPLNEPSPVSNEDDEPVEDRFAQARAAAEEVTNPTRPDEQARGQIDGTFRPLNEPPSSETPTGETPGPETNTPPIIDTEGPTGTGPEAPGTTETPPADPDAQGGVDREAEATAELQQLRTDLDLKRDAYIKARNTTRSFWKNLWGNIKHKLDPDKIGSPNEIREKARGEYEEARNALIARIAEQNAKDKGLVVPEALPEDASDEDKAHAEQQKKQYDREVLAKAVSLIATEKAYLARLDFNNAYDNKTTARKALEKVLGNPYVKMAISGGLLASTATGFVPGIAVFGAARVALSTTAMKGGLDFVAEQYAGKVGDEKKNMTEDQVKAMDQAERDRREAALAEMGIKRGRFEDSDTEKAITDVSQAEISEIVRQMIDRGEVTGNTPQERSASVLNTLLKSRLNEAIDSKIDKNRKWNTRRWVMALAGGAALAYFTSELPQSAEASPDSIPEASVNIPEPTIETTSVTPWETASGHGYSWTGWQEGQIRDVLKMSPDFQGEADVQNWINTHPAEYAHAKNAITEAMQQANPGIDVAGEGVLGQEYKVPTNLNSVIENAIRSGSNVS